jgi:hypothetical protein
MRYLLSTLPRGNGEEVRNPPPRRFNWGREIRKELPTRPVVPTDRADNRAS